MAKYNEKGQEVPDGTPIALPVGYSAPESMEMMVARMCRVEMSRIAEKHGLETFDEADDFDVDDDVDLESGYQKMLAVHEEVPRVRDKSNVDRGKGDSGGDRGGSQPGVERVDQRAAVQPSGGAVGEPGKSVPGEAYSGPERRGKTQ